MAFSMRWPTQFAVITQKFGERPEYYKKFGLPGHEGIDFQAPEGSEIYSVADGFVLQVRLDGNSDPAGKPYGNQVRIQHEGGYTSVYAHLSQVVVAQGQGVKSGQLIGLGGNTGNSFGAHLHFSLKEQGATASGKTKYPYDIIDPTPFLQPFSGGQATTPQPPAKTTMDVEINSPEAGFLNMRSEAYVGSTLVTQIKHGTKVGSLEEADITRNKIGQDGQWLWVRTSDKKDGYVAAWYLKLPSSASQTQPTPLIFVVVDSPDDPLKLRSGPGVEHAIVAQMAHNTSLKALESEAAVRSKVGQQGQWLQVQTPTGVNGYTAAWYLKLSTTSVVQPEPVTTTGAVRYVQVESPEFGLKVRSGPSVDSKQVWWVSHKTVLESLEDPKVTGTKVGVQDQWIKVRTPSGKEGYVAAWYVRRMDYEDTRKAAEKAALPKAVSPHIFGMHAAQLSDDAATRDAIRGLYNGKNKQGWIFFTELVAMPAQSVQLNQDYRNRLWDWVTQGYGVIVRLNHSYHPGGTLPESSRYDEFAAACARWVELHLLHAELPNEQYTWTIQIANEQNNPSEHPGGYENPKEHITPELYATAFNKVYARIKAVLPNSIVCPGAVDPYNSVPMKLLGGQRWRPLDYFQKMMDNITALDGIILHAYTHGPSLAAITHQVTFGDALLSDHCFDFQTYSQFAERIPAKWKEVPVYITETNHICRGDNAPACDRKESQGWTKENIGWVRKVYEEINRWNSTPYAQQIRALLPYRWMGDQWEIYNKPGVLEDFRQALDNDYRWRAPKATAAGAVAFALPMEAQAAAPAGVEEERALMQPDDLASLWWLGPKSAMLLNAAGVLIFEQLAAMTPAQIKAILGEAGLLVRHVDSWPEQARLAAAGQWKELDVYQRRLGKKAR